MPTFWDTSEGSVVWVPLLAYIEEALHLSGLEEREKTADSNSSILSFEGPVALPPWPTVGWPGPGSSELVHPTSSGP